VVGDTPTEKDKQNAQTANKQKRNGQCVGSLQRGNGGPNEVEPYRITLQGCRSVTCKESRPKTETRNKEMNDGGALKPHNPSAPPQAKQGSRTNGSMEGPTK